MKPSSRGDRMRRPLDLTTDPAAVADPPLPNTYWVVPGRLLAGEYPGRSKLNASRERVRRLLEIGIDCFINLTHPDELEPYDVELPEGVEHHRIPIRDHDVPEGPEHMAEILVRLEGALAAGRNVYVHCHAGIGRTGTVIGCWLVERGFPGEDALDELNRLWRQCSRALEWGAIPETPEQVEFVLRWRPQGLAVASSLRGARTSAAPLAGRRGSPGREEARRAAPALPLIESDAAQPAAATLRERFLGSFVGLAIGDALAAPAQNAAPGSFEPITGLRGGGPFALPAGAWSDDTAMALCLAESLLECNGFEPRDQVDRYWRWQREGRPSATGRCVGIRSSTARALALAQWRRLPFAGSHDPRQLDPDPLSRVAPVVMFFFDRPDLALQCAADAARTTCQSPVVLDACRLFAAMLYGALAGYPKDELLSPGPDLLGPVALKPRIERLRRGTYREVDASRIRAGENVIEALRAALWAFAGTESFSAGALRVANLGGSCDVAAAVYGQLAGAYYGLGAIPREWQNLLIGREIIVSLAERLLERAQLRVRP